MSKNIVEVYIEKKGQLKIFVSGLSGCGKTRLAKDISRDFKIDRIDMNTYCDKSRAIKSKIDDKDVLNWDSDDIYDWEKLKSDIKSKNTYVISGTSFPKKFTDEINADFHVHIKLSKQNIMKKRDDFIDDYKNECQSNNINTDKQMELKIFNRFTFPYYDQILKNSNITKYINANAHAELQNDEFHNRIYDDAFDYLINKIELVVNSEQRIFDKNNKNSKNNKDGLDDSDSEESYALINSNNI